MGADEEETSQRLDLLDQYVQKKVQEATEKLIGAMKLYQTHGKNIDGTMSQKVITEGVQSINLNVDSEDEECLIIDLPWDDIHGKY